MEEFTIKIKKDSSGKWMWEIHLSDGYIGGQGWYNKIQDAIFYGAMELMRMKQELNNV